MRQHLASTPMLALSCAVLTGGFLLSLSRGLRRTDDHASGDTLWLFLLYAPALLSAGCFLLYQIHHEPVYRLVGRVCLGLLVLASFLTVGVLVLLHQAYGSGLNHSDKVLDYVFFLPIFYCVAFLLGTLVRPRQNMM